MSRVDDLSRRLAGANRHARTALVAQCAARVLPVYEEYWVGTYSGSVGRSVQIGWLVACGTPADSAEVRTCLAELEDVVSFYHEDGIGVLANATTVAMRVLQSVTGDEAEATRAVARGLLSVVETAQAAESMANQGIPKDKRIPSVEPFWKESSTARSWWRSRVRSSSSTPYSRTSSNSTKWGPC